MSDPRKISIPSDVVFREVGGETVLLNLESETYYGLDEIGTEILRIMRQGASVEDAVDALLPQFDVESEVLARDIGELVDELARHGLVHWE